MKFFNEFCRNARIGMGVRILTDHRFHWRSGHCNLGVIARTMELFCFRMFENSTDTTAEVLDSVRCESNGIGFEIPWAFQRHSKNWACVKMEHRISTTDV